MSMYTPQRLNDLATPAFVVNATAFRQNCELARTSTYANGIHRLRPHIKTHKTKEGCLIQAGIWDNGIIGGAPASAVIGFVASTIPELTMLTQLACQHQCKPFNDVLYGMPICKSKLLTIQNLKNKLAMADGDIHLVVDNQQQVEFLEDFICDTVSGNMKWSVFLKVDTGYHRAGVACNQEGVSLALQIAESTCLSLKGLYSHCGHSHGINDDLQMLKAAEEDHDIILEFLKSLADCGTFDTSLLEISVGSTASLVSHKKLEAPNSVDLHPGNYVFYDRQQLFTGACVDESFVAGLVLSRVIGHYEDRDRNSIMVDAGASALTKEQTPQGDVCAVFGHPELECYRMSQEVTMIRSRKNGTPFPFKDYPLGSMMLLIPNHSCLSAGCFGEYHIVDEVDSPLSTNSEIIGNWIPVRGWA